MAGEQIRLNQIVNNLAGFDSPIAQCIEEARILYFGIVSLFLLDYCSTMYFIFHSIWLKTLDTFCHKKNWNAENFIFRKFCLNFFSVPRTFSHTYFLYLTLLSPKWIYNLWKVYIYWDLSAYLLTKLTLFHRAYQI